MKNFQATQTFHTNEIRDHLSLKVYSVIDTKRNSSGEIYSREYVYTYTINNMECGNKIVDESIRDRIISEILEIEKKIIEFHKYDFKDSGKELYEEIKKVGHLIFSFILSEEIREILFNSENFV